MGKREFIQLKDRMSLSCHQVPLCHTLDAMWSASQLFVVKDSSKESSIPQSFLRDAENMADKNTTRSCDGANCPSTASLPKDALRLRVRVTDASYFKSERPDIFPLSHLVHMLDFKFVVRP